jgi:hypothetical protein
MNETMGLILFVLIIDVVVWASHHFSCIKVIKA